jgi:DnaJ-class molecular chaperone
VCSWPCDQCGERFTDLKVHVQQCGQQVKTRVSQYFENRTIYDILQLPTTASVEEIKKAYKKHVLQIHPDKHSDKSAEEQEYYAEVFKVFQQMYSLLIGEE